MKMEYENFLNLHEPQLLACGIPKIYWQTLCVKLRNDVLDCGKAFEILLIDYENDVKNPEDPLWTVQVTDENGIAKDDVEQIYLIDHAWTYRLSSRKQQLLEVPYLKRRMCHLMDIENENENENDIVDNICNKMWKFCQNYSMNSSNFEVEDCMPVWYIMDELGSRIQHSDSPNFRVVPFLYIPKQMTYSVMFPIRDVAKGENVTRDFVEGLSANDDLIRKALLLPWFSHDFKNESFVQMEPGVEYFLSGSVDETLSECSTIPKMKLKPLRVFAQYKYVKEFLTNSNFEICDEETSADILWYSNHFKNYRELSIERPNTFVNQFPFENIITTKDLLSIICRRKSMQHHDINSLNTLPEWLPTTYNLKTELVQFISYFQNRESKGLDNTWICKPFNLARGLDTHITNDLNCIIQISKSGPKIVQKYIENPVLFIRPETQEGVKFDIRYIILLKSVNRLEAYIYNNYFLRFANKPFGLEDFDVYEKHFTVMNYNNKEDLYHLKCADFKIEWAKQYPMHNYSDIEDDIKKMLLEMLECASCKESPLGIQPNYQSRALYAADIMLQWCDGSIKPKLLEVNWMPDCKRACEYYPDFYNSIFDLLFTNEFNLDQFQKL